MQQLDNSAVPSQSRVVRVTGQPLHTMPRNATQWGVSKGQIMETVVVDPLVTRKQARESFFAGVSRSTLRRWEVSGKLPPLIRVSPRVWGWRLSSRAQFRSSREGASA